MTMQSSTLLRSYLDILNEANNPQIQVPPVPNIPPQDGEPSPGEKVSTNPDGTRSYAGAFGTFTYDKSGNAIRYDTPAIGGLSQSKDLTTGRTTTKVQQGELDISTSSGGGTPDVTSANLGLGTMDATVNKGVGFGGAGKDVQGPYQGTITNKMTGKTTNVVGKLPTANESNSLREYLNILNEGPPPGVGPNAAPKAQQSTTQKRADDLEAGSSQAAQGVEKFSQGNYASGAMDVAKGLNTTANAAGMSLLDKIKAGWIAIKAGVSAATTKGDPMYAAMGSLGKNMMDPMSKWINSPTFEKDFVAGLEAARNNPQADAYLKQMVTDYDAKKLTPQSFKAYMQRMIATNAAQQKGDKVDYDVDDNYEVKPAAESINQKKSILEHIEDIENEGSLSSGDYFHIELAEDEGIETYVIAEWTESVLVEADATVLKLLEEHGATFQDELTEAEYQGRKVQLGKRMPGDVKKSKVYVRKPNGKVVKVNFGDKKMKIKKSNPARRRSFRARHNCDNPGPRWKARYWSCRAW